MKKYFNRLFIDGLSGMALGLFATLIIGTILCQIGTILGNNIVATYFTAIGNAAKTITGAGIGVGVASTIGGKRANENSFGLIALCSVGPIIAVMILALTAKGNLEYPIPDYSIADNVFQAFFHSLADVTVDVTIALGMIVGFFLIINLIFLHINILGGFIWK